MTFNKYGNTKTTVDGIKFDSYLESKHYQIIKSLKERGVIADFTRQDVIELQPRFRRNGRLIRPIQMRPDFTLIFPDGTKVYVESKGVETDDFKLKLKMLWYHNPDIRYVLAKSADTPNLETIIRFEKERDIDPLDLKR